MARSRHAQAELLDWFPRILLLIVAMVVIVLLVKVYADREAQSPELSRGVYAYRLFYSDIIMYEDEETGRVYPGVVDAKKLTPDRLDNVFKEKLPGADWSKISSAVTVTPRNCALSVPTIYNDKTTFERYSPFGTTLGSKGGMTSETFLFPVTLRDGQTRCAATLNITVVRPNS